MCVSIIPYVIVSHFCNSTCSSSLNLIQSLTFQTLHISNCPWQKKTQDQYVYYFYCGSKYHSFQVCKRANIYISWPTLQKKAHRVVSPFIALHFHTFLSSVCAAVRAWLQLSDVKLDKRSWVHAVTAHLCPCYGPIIPSHGSIACPLSGQLSCKRQWLRLPKEA